MQRLLSAQGRYFVGGKMELNPRLPTLPKLVATHLSLLESSTLALISMSVIFLVFLAALFGFSISIKASTPLDFWSCKEGRQYS